jgi:acetate kinase
MNILVLNAGSASLKFEVIATPELPFTSDKQHKLVSGIVEGIGEELLIAEQTLKCVKTS